MLTRNKSARRRRGARRAVAGRAGRRAGADQDRRAQQLQGLSGLPRTLQEGLGAGGRGGQRRGRRARPQDRGREPRRQRQSRRRRARRRGAVEPRGRVVPDRHLPVQRRPRRRRLRQAAQGAVHRRRAADRQDRVGRRQRLHLPPAHLDLHADGDAHSRRRQAQEEALGDRLSQLRVRPVGDGGLQEAPEGEAARRRVRHRAGARRSARSTPARWRRRWPTPSPTRSSPRCSVPTSPSSCARASSAASSRASRSSTCWPASPSISIR